MFNSEVRMLPKFPIKTTFDPSKSAYAAELWAIPAGRILMLLWRTTHLCSPDWFAEALPIAKRIEKARPKDSKSLLACFSSGNGTIDFTPDDCRDFSVEAIDFFTGKRHVPFEGTVSGNAAMIRE